MKKTLIALLWLLSTAYTLQAQRPQRDAFATDSTGRMYKLAEGVYAITHAAATPDWPHGNTGVIIGRNAVMVIDSDYLPDRAEMDIALIRKVTNLPVRYLVNTHWHGDHTHGNSIYRDSFPDIAIIGPRASAQFFDLNLEKLPRQVLKPESYTNRRLASLEATLQRGADSTGRRLNDAERTSIRTEIAQRRNEVAQMARIKVEPPNVLFDDRLTIDLGGKVVEIRDMGRANSPNDVTIHVPSDQVLFTGDILVSPLPYAIGSSPTPWIEVLKKLEATPVRELVPGHGPVFTDHSYTTLVRTTFEMIQGQIDSLYRSGIGLDAAVAQVNVDGQRTKFIGRDGSPINPDLWKQWTRGVSQQIAECFHGYRC